MILLSLLISEVFVLFMLYLPQGLLAGCFQSKQKHGTGESELATTSHVGHRCHCRQYSFRELNDDITIKGIKLKIQSGLHEIDSGGFGSVKHTFDP
uniref:Candidate secreted effector n=1 Tax=Meloidogyne incognita TaxID=6306 RepID=A0A914L0H5_MELIC